MKEDVFDVLMYLFENYMDDDHDFSTDQETLSRKLSQAGFQSGEISKAFTWLEDLSALCDADTPAIRKGTPTAHRHYTENENKKLARACRGYLVRLEHTGVLDAHSRELVIDRAMALESEEIDLEQLKWVVMMVLYNQPEQDHVQAWLEDIVFEDPVAFRH